MYSIFLLCLHSNNIFDYFASADPIDEAYQKSFGQNPYYQEYRTLQNFEILSLSSLLH